MTPSKTYGTWHIQMKEHVAKSDEYTTQKTVNTIMN